MHSPPRAVRCPLLIGRDDLLELVDRRLDDVLAGHGQFLLLAGQAGIGKTRFLGAIRRKAESRGFAAVEGAVAPQDHDVPASSILDLARSMVRIPAFAELGQALLELDKAVLVAEHAQRRRLVMETVELILGALPGPTMLSFEDLQWADDVSLEIIAELARRSRDRQLLLTGDYRTEDVPRGTSLRQWRSRLITQRIAEELRLMPLDRGRDRPRHDAPPRHRAAGAARRRGCGLRADRRHPAPHRGAARRARAPRLASTARAIREADVPDTIEDAVLARLARLSPEAQATARAGAVIGRCFVPDVLAGIMDVPPDALEAPLQELVDQFVLDPPGVRGLYDFRHQLLRDALYRTIPASDRRRFHARAGEFGARLEGASEIHASVHYERAGLRREAFEAALAGAREAARLSARREAFELYRRAVDNMPDDLDPAERAAILTDVRRSGGGRSRNTRSASGRLMKPRPSSTAPLGMPVRGDRGARQSCSAYGGARRGRWPTAVAMARGMWAELDRSRAISMCWRPAHGVAQGLAIDGPRRPRPAPEARKQARSSAAFADELGDHEWRLVAEWKAGLADVIEGDVQGGLARVGEVASEAAREAGKGPASRRSAKPRRSRQARSTTPPQNVGSARGCATPIRSNSPIART